MSNNLESSLPGMRWRVESCYYCESQLNSLMNKCDKCSMFNECSNGQWPNALSIRPFVHSFIASVGGAHG